MNMLRPALRGVIFFAIVCGGLVVAWAYMPAMGVKWYPSLWVRLAAISPLFFASRMAPAVYRELRQPMASRERIAFAGFLCAGVALVAVLVEAALVSENFGPQEGLGYFQILFQPLHKRYTLTVFAGLGFGSAALLAAGFVAFLSVPIRVLSLHQQTKPAAPEA